MDYIILGLLLLRARTIYELRKRIEEGLNLMYSCSTGSIQAAIKKLLGAGYISVEERTENGKLKKIYSITKQGRDYFNSWVNGNIQGDTVKIPELTKVYFMGLSEESGRIEILKNYINDLKAKYLVLEKICEDGELALTEQKNNDILFYQLQTAIYGRDMMRFNIDWYEALLKRVKER